MNNAVDSVLQPKNRNKRGGEFDVPDEIAIEILSRLPAVDVVRLRSVCKRWRDLTSSRRFTGLHLQHSLPMVLFQVEGSDNIGDGWFDKQLDHYLFDRWWEPLQSQPKSYEFGKSSDFKILFSNGGLIVLQHQVYSIYRIMNPLYHENVQITISEGLRMHECYGVFFHPLLNEYCTLWRIGYGYGYGEITSTSVEIKLEEYRILNLGSKPCWREINNPWSHVARVRHIPPILIDEHLYLVVKDEPGSRSKFSLDIMEYDISCSQFIMEFDIRKEEFSFISSPVPRPYRGNKSGPYRCNKWNIDVLDIGGHLSLVGTSQFEYPPSKKPFEVNIWTLKDHTKQLWTFSSYSINTNACFFGPIALVKDELLFRCRSLRFTCNLKLGVVRKSEFHIDGNRSSILTAHVMSLASLKNCKSEIYMDGKGEVEKYTKSREDISVELMKNTDG